MSSERCRECGAANVADAEVCWLCGDPLCVAAEVVSPKTGRAKPPTAPQFALATVCLAVALTSALFGVYQFAPGLGIVLTVLVVPPFLATCIAVIVRRLEGRALTPLAALTVFGATAGITAGVVAVVALVIVLVMIAAVVLFFVRCLAGPGAI